MDVKGKGAIKSNDKSNSKSNGKSKSNGNSNSNSNSKDLSIYHLNHDEAVVKAAYAALA